MTTPNQSVDLSVDNNGTTVVETIASAVGLGAYQIGGGSQNFGQDITHSFVTDFVYGALSPSNVAANSGLLTDVVSVMETMMTTVPVSVLKYLQPFIPGATDADFADSATAAAFITATFIPKMVVDTTNWFGRLVQDVETLFDVFHITYQAGTPTDPPGTLGTNGKPTWYASWNDLMELIGLYSGTTPTTPAPTLGTAITSATGWVTRLMQDLEILFDVFHLTYNAGTSSDPPGTLGVGGVGAGKPTWYSAWNDVLQLIGLATGSTPTSSAPTIGTAITGAQTTANTASSWGARLTNDLIVTSDVFHLVYHTGTPTDAPGLIYTGGGLGNGKMTWYGAWNDLLALCGVVNSVTAPTDAAPTTGAVIQANTATATTASTNASIAIASNQATNDAIVSATTGSPVTGSSTTDVTTGLSNIPATNVVGGAGAAVTFGASGPGNVTTTPGTPLTISETHTIAAGDLGVLAFITYEALSSTAVTSSVTYGGTAMTLLYSLKSSAYSSNASWLEVWWLTAPPSGAKTVTATVTPASGSAGLLSLQTESYAASKIGTVSPASGGGSTSLSMSASSATGRMVAGAFHAVKLSAAVTLSAYSQTQRYNWSGGPGWANAIGDAAGASTVAFAATASVATTTWIGITVELKN